MSDFPRVDLRYSSDHDWVRVYINGVLQQEGHSVRVEDILVNLGIKVTSFTHEFEGDMYSEGADKSYREFAPDKLDV